MQKVWTHTAYLVIDAANSGEESLYQIGEACLAGGELFLDILPGLSVSGRVVLKLKERGEK